MAKEDVAPAIAAPVAGPITVSLNEYCTRLSATVLRPELIGAFAHTERAAGNLSGTEAAFKARYAAFINKPV